MKQLNLLSIEQIISLPFFYKLEKMELESTENEKCITPTWRITFRCNRHLPDGGYQLLDEISATELMVRYKLIDFKHKKNADESNKNQTEI